jgi:hypothetical protein
LLENKIFKENYVSKEQGLNCALGYNHVLGGEINLNSFSLREKKVKLFLGAT